MCDILQDRLLAFFLQFISSRTQTGIKRRLLFPDLKAPWLKKDTTGLQLKKDTTGLQLKRETASLQLKRGTAVPQFKKETAGFQLKKDWQPQQKDASPR